MPGSTTDAATKLHRRPTALVLCAALAVTALIGVSVNSATDARAQSIEDLQRKAERGDAQAQFTVGHRHYTGEGVRKSYARARTWFEKAADQEYASAYDFLGEIYYLGRGVKQNHRRAREYWALSSEAGLETGHYNLGGAYYFGLGGPKRRSEAIQLWRRAAAMGNQGAVDIMKENGITPVDPRAVQSRLTDLGYDPGPIDGKPGGQTRRAIRAFQRDRDLPQDGKLTVELLAALNEDAPAPRHEPALTVADPAKPDTLGGNAKTQSATATPSPPPEDLSDLDSLD